MSWKGWTVLVIAVWLIIAAFISGFSGGNGAVANNTTENSTNTTATKGNMNSVNLFSLTNFIIVGIIFATMGLFMFSSSKVAAWITLLSGIWLIIISFIPAITSSSSASLTNGLIFGILVLIFSFFDRRQKA